MFAGTSHGTELKRFFRLPLTRAALAIMLLIPLLYGAMYVWAFWDPTDRMDHLPVALVNEDRPATLDGEPLNAGKETVDKLLDKKPFAWHQVDAAEATDGVRTGRYYFAVTIPADYSSSIASLKSDSPKRARIDVTYDDSNSFLASTLGQSAMLRIKEAVNEASGQQAVDKLLIGLDDVRTGLGKASDGAFELTDGLKTAVDGTVKLEVGATELNKGAAQLAAGTRTLADGTASALTQAAPLAPGVAQLNGGATQAATGAATLAASQDAYVKGVQRAGDGAAQLAAGAAKLTTLLDGLAKLSDPASGAPALASGASQLADGVDTLAAKSAQLASGATQTSAGASQLDASLKQLSGALSGPLGAALTSDDAAMRAAALAQLQGALAKASGGATQVAGGAAQVAGGASTLAGTSGAQALQSGAQHLKAGTQSLVAGASELTTKASDQATGLPALIAGATQLNDGFHNADPQQGLIAGAKAIDAGAHQLSDGSAQVAAGTSTLSSKVPTLLAGMQKLNAGASQLATGSGKLAGGTSELSSKVPELSDGLTKAHDGAQELAAQLKDGQNKVLNDSDAVRTARAEAVQSPVKLNESWIDKATSWGEGFAPFFISLALWVGAVITWLLLRPLQTRPLMTSVSGFRTAWGSLNSALVLAIGQVLIMLGVMRWGLGLEMAHPIATILFTLLTAFAFMALQQLFQVAFGTAPGKVIAIVLLMIQLASAGGTYPIEVEPGFLRAINPYMPMTYVVQGLRETITGGIEQRFWVAVIVLAAIFVFSLVASSFMAARKRMWSMSRLHPALSL